HRARPAGALQDVSGFFPLERTVEPLASEPPGAEFGLVHGARVVLANRATRGDGLGVDWWWSARRITATAAATTGHRRTHTGTAAHELHRLCGLTRGTLLGEERNALRHPIRRRLAFQVVVVELMQTHHHVVLVLVAGEA